MPAWSMVTPVDTVVTALFLSTHYPSVDRPVTLANSARHLPKATDAMSLLNASVVDKL